MATLKLIVASETYNYPVGKGIYFSYIPSLRNGLLYVWRDGCLIHEKSGVKPGTAFIVEINKDRTKLKKASTPHRKDDLLMWILSFKKEDRTYDPKDYEGFLEERRRLKECPVYACENIEGEGYKFILRDQSISNGGKNIAAYLDSRKLDKAMVKEILHRWELEFHMINWPQELVEKLLRNRFGFNDADIADLAGVRWYTPKVLTLGKHDSDEVKPQVYNLPDVKPGSKQYNLPQSEPGRQYNLPSAE